MLDAVNVLRIMSKKTIVASEFVQEMMKSRELRLFRTFRYIANHRMKTNSVDRRVVHRYVKRSSRRLSYDLKIRNFEIIIRLAAIEALIETHCLHSRKSRRH